MRRVVLEVAALAFDPDVLYVGNPLDLFCIFQVCHFNLFAERGSCLRSVAGVTRSRPDVPKHLETGAYVIGAVVGGSSEAEQEVRPPGETRIK